MNYFIVATRKSGGSESEITHYEYNHDKSSSGTVISKQSLWNEIDTRTDSFYSYNPRQGTTVECKWYKSENGEPFLKSDPNGTQKDNLLELPDC